MSSVSSIGSGLDGLSQYFKRISDNNSAQTANAGSSADAAPSDPNDFNAAASQAVPHHHGHHHGGGGVFFKKIQDAVSSALQSASSNGSADPNQVVQSAIAKVLQEGGPNGSANDPTNPNAPDALTAESLTGSASSAPAAPTGPQALSQLLQSAGIDPKQFHADFLAAVKDAQNGNVDPSNALKSFPPGVNLDAIG